MLSKGTTQGLTFGPFLFNVFQNDLALILEHLCDMYIIISIIILWTNKIVYAVP